MEVTSTILSSLIYCTLFFSVVHCFPNNGYTYENPKSSFEEASRRTEIYASNKINVPLDGVGEAVSEKIDQTINAKTINIVTPFPNSGRQRAVLESSVKESLPIQADIKYGNLQNFVRDLLHPKPIVDTIQEHEKYGNSGDKSRGLGIFVVSAFEGLSNAVNAAVDAPFQAVKTSGRKLTAALNQVGGKLVGLAK